MAIFHTKCRAVKNWHDRALIINFNETNLTIIESNQEKTIPPWVNKKFIQDYR